MRAGALSLFLPPLPVPRNGDGSRRALRKVEGKPRLGADLVSRGRPAGSQLRRGAPGGVALIVVLPRAESSGHDPEVLQIVGQCRPHSILPYHPEPNPRDLRALLSRMPEDLASEITDYIAWGGITVDGDTRRLIRRTIELAGEVRSVSGSGDAAAVVNRPLPKEARSAVSD